MRTTLKTALMLIALSTATPACVGDGRAEFPVTESPLKLSRVVLYRNGVGYFERRGEVEGDLLRLRVRKDQVNDLLKSLTIVDRLSGQAVSVSMPLDPDTWARAALATLGPGRGSLAEVLDLLRGAEVELDTLLGKLEGRVVLVETISDEPDPTTSGRGKAAPEALGNDYRVTLMAGAQLKVVRLSKVRGVMLKDGDLAMQFHRRLDATAGEGMFQQVEVAIRLSNKDKHDLLVSYVVEAPMWKPTYRVVLPKEGKGEALLQGWAVVDNTSGEQWNDVQLSLTAGAPIAFRYDLHTPRRVFREDLSERVHRRRARVAMGETTFEPATEEDEEEGDSAGYEDDDLDARDGTVALGKASGSGRFSRGRKEAPAAAPPPPPADDAPYRYKADKKMKGKAVGGMLGGDYFDQGEAEKQQRLTIDGLRRSTQAQTRASQASGLTRYDIGNPVTVPDGSATMVAIINQAVQGEEAFLFDPNGGGGAGYEANPFRVVRFRNTSPFVLETGPISIYSGGSFVGEGISQQVGAGTSATIPFAVEPGIMITRESPSTPQELKLVKIVRGTIYAERFHQVKSIWKIKAQTIDEGFKVLIRQPKYAQSYKLKDRPEGTEDLPGAYLIPVVVAKGSKQGGIEVIEQSPSQTTIGLWDSGVLPMLELAMIAQNFSPQDRQQLKPLIDLRREIGKLDTKLSGLRRRESTLNRRISQHRRNLGRLKDMRGAEAEQMRRERARKLEEFTKEGDEIAREILKLEEKREQKVIILEDKIATLTINPKS
jgi:Domain of unknown function (DUF4139)